MQRVWRKSGQPAASLLSSIEPTFELRAVEQTPASMDQLRLAITHRTIVLVLTLCKHIALTSSMVAGSFPIPSRRRPRLMLDLRGGLLDEIALTDRKHGSSLRCQRARAQRSFKRVR